MVEAFVFDKPLTTEELKAASKPKLQAYLKKLEADQEAAKKAKSEEMDKSWDDFAGDITEKLFKEFSGMSGFLERCVEQIENRYWVISPIGRRRTMYRVLTGKRKFIADAGRRAKNSPIQGISSEVGVTSGFLVMKETHKYMLDRKIDMKYFSKYCRAVHDANYYEESYCMVLPAIHIKQYMATYGVTQYYRDVFNFEMGIEPEIEIEVGANEGKSKKWDWDVTQLAKILVETVDELVGTGAIAKEKRDKTIQTIFQPWIDKENRDYLQANWPLLNIKNLDKQICAALRSVNLEPEE